MNDEEIKGCLNYYIKILGEKYLEKWVGFLKNKVKSQEDLALGLDIILFDMIYGEFGVEEEDLLKMGGILKEKGWFNWIFG